VTHFDPRNTNKPIYCF